MRKHRHSRRTTHMRTHQLELPVHVHAPASGPSRSTDVRPVKMENNSRRALPPATRDTGDQKGKISPHAQAEARSSWVELPGLACPVVDLI